jgi:hypothetical protein
VSFSGAFTPPPGRPLKDMKLSVPVEVHTERFVVDLPEVNLR